MKLHKTPQKERSTYSYQFFDADGKPEPRITIHPGADDVTEVDIKQQHAFDDSEVYFNIKALRPEEDEQQKAEKAVWRERYITDFTAKYGYKPHAQDITDAANEEFPKYWIASLDEMQEGDENHDGYMDKSSILASLCTSDDPEESPLVERLRELIAGLPSKEQTVYRRVLICGEKQKTVAEDIGLSPMRVSQIVQKIQRLIAGDKILQSFFR